MKYILCCSCFNMEKKSREAFSVIKPDEVLPDIVKGKDRIFQLAKKLDNEHIRAISKLSGRFSYYVKLEDGEIVEEYDLVRGTRIA